MDRSQGGGSLSVNRTGHNWLQDRYNRDTTVGETYMVCFTKSVFSVDPRIWPVMTKHIHRALVNDHHKTFWSGSVKFSCSKFVYIVPIHLC